MNTLHNNFSKEARTNRFLFQFLLLITCFVVDFSVSYGLTVSTDPNCTTRCCQYTQPCSCSAGVIVTGAIGPVNINVFLQGGGIVGTTACVTGLCPGTYLFEVRDATPGVVIWPVTIGGSCCTLLCRDTTICFGVPDSSVHLKKPLYADTTGGSIGGTRPPCAFDSIWNNSPGVYPVGTTVVTWYVVHNGILDSCTSNVTRNPPSPFQIIFTTVPPIVGGVINICNGQSITFIDNSIGKTGLLWNFGNGYYSSNSNHTEPASHYPPGTYYDTLTVFDDCGFPHDTAFMVVVDSASGPDIYCISVQCPGDTVTYHTNANCSTYNWAVTGGVFFPVPATTSDSATVIWGAGPQGTISLSVANCNPPSTCAIATVKTVHIVPATLPVSGDTMICAGSTVTYCIECIPGNNHIWEMIPANAGTITGQGTCCVTIQFNPTFVGIVTLTVNYQNVLTGSGCNLPDGCTNDPGCGGTGHIVIDVRPVFGISGPSKVCPNTLSAPFNGMNLTFNTIEPGTSWKLVTPIPSTLTFATTALLNAYLWNAGLGYYTLTAYAPPNIYCNDSATVTVEVVEIKIPNNITGPDTVCANVPVFYSVIPNMGGVTYTWTVIGGTINGNATGSSVSITWNPGGGTVSVIQTLTSPPGCVSASSATFTVVTWPNFPLPVITPSALIVCLKSSVTYSIPPVLLSNATYTWSVVPSTAGNIITANGLNQITIKWVDASITPIWVKLKISRCYEDSVMFPVNLLALPPVPSISFTPPNPCVNDIVNFSTTSAGPFWNWNFGDAGTSTLQNPSHAYTTAGDFTVQLYVTNANGCSDTAYTKVHVDDIPVVPVITGPTSVCVNTTMTYSFSQPLFMGANYTWSLSAPALGSILSFGNTFCNVRWLTPGVDTVLLHLQSTCLDTIVKLVVTVSGLPTPGISVASPACVGAVMSYNGTGGTSYSWVFGGGSPGSSLLQTQPVTYGVAGTYTTTLTVTNASGCTATTSTNVTINPLPLAIITGPYNICAFPATVTMAAVNLAGYTFNWTPSGNTPSITQTITGPTTFSVVVTNSFNCTQTSNSITVTLVNCPPPDTSTCIAPDTINFIAKPPVCLSDSFIKTGNATLTGWTFGDGGSAGNSDTVTHTYAIPGIYLVTVSGTANGLDGSGNPCVKNVSKSKFITIPFDTRFTYSFQCNGLGQMQTIFSNTSLYLNAATNYSWTWKDSTNNTVLSTNPFPGPILLSAGTHLIYLATFDNVTQARCTTFQTINVPVPIQASFTVTSPVCKGSTALFTNTSTGAATSIFFNNGNGATSTTSPANLIYTGTGPYTATLTVTDQYGCVSTATQSVNVLPPGTGTITVGPNSCDSVQLTASGTGPFTWNVINPPPFPTNPVYVKTSGFYSVTAIDVNGCPYTFGPVQITVKKSPVVVITGKTQYCQGENLDIKTYTAGTIFAWSQISPFLGPVGTNSPNLTVVPGTTGTIVYQCSVTSANLCVGTATYTVVVDPVPASAVIVASGPLTFCDGDSVILTVNPTGASYKWSKSPTPPLTSPADTMPALIVKVSGTYSVIVQTPSGCAFPAIAPVTVTVNPRPPANITGDTVLCEGETLSLQTTPVGGGTYSWSGPVASGNTNPFVVPNMQMTDSGQYIVVVTNQYGCTNSDTTTVIVNPTPAPPVIISNPGGVLCEGQLYNLSVVGPLGPPIVYTWSTNQIGYSINVAMVGSYYVTASNQFGCNAQSNVITVHPVPDLSCAPTGCYEFCNECDSVTIPGPVGGITSYNWQILLGNIWTNYSMTQNLTVYPPGGIYRLLAANQWGCADSTDTLKIDFTDCCPPPDTNCLDTCVAFNNNSPNGFQPHPSAPNVGLFVTNILSQGGISDYYLQATDQAGPSQLLAGSQFNGKWCCGEFCFDYRIFDDAVAGSVNVNPSFIIRNGTLGFTFVSSQVVNENSGWSTICAPITDCKFPPVTPAGTWTPLGGTAIADWQTVLNFVTELVFRVDFSPGVGETSGFDNICIHSDLPEINAGNDTTICAGGIITLHVEGCNSIPEWYELVGDSIIFFANGPIVDVSPTQTTCYVVICCGAAPCCCDTDTICITVNPLPQLQWPVIFPDVCLNGDSVYLDTLSIIALPPGGTGVFSGVGVSGNYFHPTTLGPHTITYCYTDTNGCTSCVSNIINVIFCCNTSSCHVDLGNDTSICAGSTVILTANGCNGTTYWYELTAGGPVPIPGGPFIDVFPQQSTCYMAVCCCLVSIEDPVGGGSMSMLCCDTDTICITVYPLPQLSWPVIFPDVCLNGDSVYLDTLSIIALPPGGTGVFSGVGVSGNYFHPTTLGPHTITYCYTDTNGCTSCVSNIINVIFCCNTSSCHVDLGNDTSICAGSTVILTANGCNGTTYWYELTAGGPVPIPGGPFIDVFPQQSTCYMAVCCCLVSIEDPVGGGSMSMLCCDTDTICITVYPLPQLSWPVVFPDVCLNGDSVYLDTLSIIALPPGGTGVFSGVGVSGNYFHPTTLGPHTITYCYTDTNGCTSCVSNTINVIFCCNTSSCHVDLGNDTSICAGSTVILTANGCNGTTYWYELTAGGPVPIPGGPFIDVFPQQSTCYMAVCCCLVSIEDPVGGGSMSMLCCDTDTICITVNPLPILQWHVTFPDVCLNGDSVYLDTLSIIALPPGGTGVFSGVGVSGNYFHPTTLGPHTITYCYTDTNGCTSCVSNIINVIFCCNTSSCHVDLGNDTSICAGSTVILTANGCNGTTYWYELTAGGPVPIPGGPFIDVFPQQSTCYMAVCCCLVSIEDPVGGGSMSMLCCDTDTICITVYPLPQLSWPIIFPDVCLNGDSVYLDTLSIIALPPGGTGVFSGVGVSGNYFHPTTLGPHTITYCYTDTNGCTSCVSNTINVIFCCNTNSCHVDLGNDTSICAGSTVILTANGCNGTTYWYELTAGGPVPIPGGPFIDVFPQQSTCYMAVCCCLVSIEDPVGGGSMSMLCCDTDTICITVNPLPILQWHVTFPDVCLNGDSVYLDTLSIIALPPGGTGVFSGVGVSGNYFHPTTLGPHTITYCYTDTNGCTSCVSNTINVIFCCNTNSCHVDLGNDTSICAGSTVILTANGCNGTTYWYELTAGGPVPIPGGPFIDVFPQQSTCYMAVCCCQVGDEDPAGGGGTGILCCDTDTICITVYPLPQLSWPVIFPDVCLNGDSVYLDTLSIIALPPGGTGVFSGIGVNGNYFHPTTLGPHTITYCYTDTNGCTACVSNTINVIFCCNTNSCHVDLGNDTSICAGSTVILTANGCSGTTYWYELGANGPVPIIGGQFIDVFPQQSTCYMVICCCQVGGDPDPVGGGGTGIMCCDTDTICITVYPLPQLSWPVIFPDVCLNGDSVYLDTLSIIALPPGGTGVFSGVGVSGNYFHPTTLGPHTITYCYTDTNGCTSCVFNSINVIYCCNTSSCHVDLGNDTSICAGSTVILTANGCSGTTYWYELGANGPVPIIGGQFIDVFPQQSTCYMVICCCQVGGDPDPVGGGGTGIMCCDTDTICITVYPLPQLSWPVIFPDVCLNGDSVYLDTLSIIALPPGGTGVFSGVGVSGNYFHPTTLGPHTITYCYTDTNGCTSCVSITINVIYCCNTSSCHVDLGNDTSICTGGVVILTANGCSGTTTWYILAADGPTYIGGGPIMDVFPQQTSCYMAICCCQPLPGINCCDTDTICITVNPNPRLEWPVSYMDVCLNSDSIYLDPYNIFVDINQTMIMLPFAGGTWYFTGTGVNGNYFHPTTLGSHTITVYYTDSNGCTGWVSNTINVISCSCDTVCQDFNNAQLNGWQPDPFAPNLLVGVSNIGSQGGQSDYYLETTDQSGASALMASLLYNKWCCGEFCYDYRVFDDGDPNSSYNIPPVMWVYSGTLGFAFTSSIVANENNGWHHVCIPIATCHHAPDSGASGFWQPVPGTTSSDWNTVTSNISRIVFRVDYSSFSSERSGIDNVCFTPDPEVDITTGSDQTICAGETATLTVFGCQSHPVWYQLDDQGQPIEIGNGPILDVSPQQSTCYVVVCCGRDNYSEDFADLCCCDADTVCVFVNPAPNANFNILATSYCVTAAPVTLTPVTPGGIFSGPGVVGNTFVPSLAGIGGPYAIVYTVTNIYGCTATSIQFVSVYRCLDIVILHVDVFIQGYYLFGGIMQPVMFNEGSPTASLTQCDTILIELHDSLDPFIIIDTAKTILNIDGHADSAVFSTASAGHSYWIVVKHRGCVETWSSAPVPFALINYYDFTTSNTAAYGDNMVEVDAGIHLWGIYSADLDQDGYVLNTDFTLYDLDNFNQVGPAYVNTDMDGDGYVLNVDYPIFDLNNFNQVGKVIPY